MRKMSKGDEFDVEGLSEVDGVAVASDTGGRRSRVQRGDPGRGQPDGSCILTKSWCCGLRAGQVAPGSVCLP